MPGDTDTEMEATPEPPKKRCRHLDRRVSHGSLDFLDVVDSDFKDRQEYRAEIQDTLKQACGDMTKIRETMVEMLELQREKLNFLKNVNHS